MVARFESMEKQRWQTSDLRLGAYLRMQGFKIACFKKMGRNVIFEFEERPERADQVTKFFNKEAVVEPLAYMASIGEMRDMVTMAEKNEHNGMGGKS